MSELTTQPIVANETGPDGHRYNGDLLLHPDDREAAMAFYPNAIHVVDHSELRQRFLEQDRLANEAKRSSRGWGFWSVVMAFSALMLSTGELFWIDLPHPGPQIIAGISGLLGISSFLIAGAGILYGRRKKDWLRSRMRTELLRQYHFQAFACCFEDIVKSIAAVRERNNSRDQIVHEFANKRSMDFETFLQRTQGSSSASDTEIEAHLDDTLELIIHPDGGSPLRLWLYGDGTEPSFPHRQLNRDAMNEVFSLYNTFRFEQQVGYATYQLRKANAPPRESKASTAVAPARAKPWFPWQHQPLRKWENMLSLLWWAGLSIVVALHVMIVCGSLLGHNPADQHVAHIFVIWACLLAVASHTLAEGNLVHREIQRYKEYLVVVSDLRREFQIPATTHERKFQLMVRMERTAFEEMRVFLRDNSDASYVF